MADSDSIALRIPSKYAPKSAAPPPEPSEATATEASETTEAADAPSDTAAPSAPSPPPPSQEWLLRTWTITHSTLTKWRSARNVRVTYKELPAKANSGLRMDDLVEYEPSSKTDAIKTVAGVDTQSAVEGGWEWKGKGLLFFVSSRWEILAWGEEMTEDGETERWAITWFAPTLFSKEGLDVYCDRKEGLSEATYRKIEEALKNDGGQEVAALAEDMMPVDIKLPWIEK